MRRASLAIALLFVLAGVFMIYGGYALKLKGQYGPGPGFTAFWIGVPLTLLSVAWLVQLCRQWKAGDPASFESERGGLRRIATVLVALVAFAALLVPVGFTLTMLALLLFLFFAFDRDHAIVKIVVALVGSFGVHYGFERFLRVPLPKASLEFLRAWGF